VENIGKNKSARKETAEKRPTIELWRVMANVPNGTSFSGWGPVLGNGTPLLKNLN